MRHIYISPHLDDAVLSAGGLILAQQRDNQQVEIWTVMAGIPTTMELSTFAQGLHSLWGTKSAEETILARRSEDDRAAGILGVHNHHFDFLDAIYRREKNNNWLYGDIYGPPHSHDSQLVPEIAKAISSSISSNDTLYCPLAIGLHVDHVIVRAAVEALNQKATYYADLPYLFNNIGQLGIQARGLDPKVLSVSDRDLEYWFEAIHAYKSQLDSLFDSIDGLNQAIRNYWEEWGGIPVWV